MNFCLLIHTGSLISTLLTYAQIERLPNKRRVLIVVAFLWWNFTLREGTRGLTHRAQLRRKFSRLWCAVVIVQVGKSLGNLKMHLADIFPPDLLGITAHPFHWRLSFSLFDRFDDFSQSTWKFLQFSNINYGDRCYILYISVHCITNRGAMGEALRGSVKVKQIPFAFAWLSKSNNSFKFSAPHRPAYTQ